MRCPKSFLIFLIAALACLEAAYAAAPPAYVDELVQQARSSGLAADPQWRALLHYQRPWFAAPRSTIKEPRFFLAPDGDKDPEAELEATLRAFAATADSSDDGAQCVFRGRYLWLSRMLSIPPFFRESLRIQ